MSYPQFDGTQACANVDVNIFFAPDEDNPGANTNYREAKQVCAQCSWTLPCSTYAIAHPELDGFWGGMSERERLSARRRLRRFGIAS